MNGIYKLALALVVVGALNWGLVGLFDYNLVDALFGTGSFISRSVYALVGLSGIIVAGKALATQGHSRPVTQS